MSYTCPCCGYLTFEGEIRGTFEVCPVCYWEDDNVQNQEPDYGCGANGISLNTAKKNFAKFGAIKQEYIKDVRKPLKCEFP